MQERFRKTRRNGAAEVWVEVGPLRYQVELYESGEFVERRTGRRPRTDEIEVHLAGRGFAALVHIQPDATARCTWSR
ncbi:MAG: hypothetical protein PVI86_01210 [Phycisphaerae bacterium]